MLAARQWAVLPLGGSWWWYCKVGTKNKKNGARAAARCAVRAWLWS